MSYIALWGPKGYGFSAVLVINRVSIFAILVINRVLFLHSSFDVDMFFKKKPLFRHYRKEKQQKPFTNYVYDNLTLV